MNLELSNFSLNCSTSLTTSTMGDLWPDPDVGFEHISLIEFRGEQLAIPNLIEYSEGLEELVFYSPYNPILINHNFIANQNLRVIFASPCGIAAEQMNFSPNIEVKFITANCHINKQSRHLECLSEVGDVKLEGVTSYKNTSVEPKFPD